MADFANPIITASVVDTNETTIALTGDEYKLIKYFSNAKATMTATPQGGAAINEDLYIIRNGTETGFGKTHTFENTESNVFRFSAEDSEGYVGSLTLTPTMIEYIKLTCNIASNRPDGHGDMAIACSGIFFNNSFGAVTNTITAQYRYKENGGAFSAWADMSVTVSGNTYFASASLSGLDYHKVYTFETRAIDKLMTISSTAASVRSIPLYHWGESDFVFEVPVIFSGGVEAVKGDLGVTGNLRLKGDGNYGNTLYFGDGSYCYISESEGDKMYIRAKRIDLDATSGVYQNGNLLPVFDKGIWAPSLDSSAISYYTTQYGWFMKMNQTVTVGFCIKAYCNSGYNTTSIRITGLPYTPMFSAAGGGMCSGVYITAGHDFQCFVAETSGNITIRVQACNNTSSGNLSTSASGCWYRSGGGEITLSGTITYMANS